MKNKYNFKEVEHQRYQNWLQKGYFITSNNVKKTFTVVIPPPNITGKLHLGHAWNNTIQDIIVRFKKMQGFDVLFLPGMDHAGIATQNKVKERLKEKGLLTLSLDKDTFLKYAWQWKDKYAANIRKQWQALGLHLDYNWEQFTLDDKLSQTVQNVFITLYQKKMIYRGYKIINWDPETKTALSNVEVNYQETQGKLYYIKYYLVSHSKNDSPCLKENNLFLEIATTRPETMFADQALMVHPDDLRYQNFIGCQVIIPGTNILIPVISDYHVDSKFGTGVVKVTPGHNLNDFEVAQRHKLKAVLCMHEDGIMNQLANQYQGLNRFDCRKKLIQDLQQKQVITKIINHVHQLGYSSISGAVIEPRLSLQWFLKTKDIAKQTLKDNKINFYPQRFNYVFNRWLENIEDWCISRQLWWGHQIPAWHKGKEIKVQLHSPGKGWTLDHDVLDTWFSSSLWPFNVLEWPDETSLVFQKRFPVDVLVTGYDILTFWVSKMVFQSILLTGKDPFKDVLLHGLVRDSQGQKMSKSKGNGVDPLDVIDQYGTDALRWFLTTNVAPGYDLLYDEIKVKAAWNFINKLWNICRFIKLNIKTTTIDVKFDIKQLSLPQKVLLHQLHEITQAITKLYQKYELKEIGKLLYHFIWEDFANWYLIFAKHDLNEHNSTNNQNTSNFLVFLIKNILQLLHPFIPFVTDALYSFFDTITNITQTLLSPMSYHNLQALSAFEDIKQLVVKMRNFRNEYNIENDIFLNVTLETTSELQQDLAPLTKPLQTLLHANSLTIAQKVADFNKILLFLEKKINLYIDQAVFQHFNQIKVQNNFLKQKKMLLEELARSEKILNNPLFLSKASPQKIAIEKKKYHTYRMQYDKLLASHNGKHS
ncbi:valine--tRNA ligase ['Fragaria x ananassa' phyllody phytoplasma]|uniref:Valine--tRNA ligase n=1 Tax='Fragaria x ananassa' phyllody phytoplasma TaxID=2358428 RepID=A0ABS5K2M9_9MOLU|nr:valine--tRNA ligase ['Fragaria x ananassa' phyllody phytoplasma]MBS2126128.1 valine--tRNA ligase ['Fragaria x ananassa' phyllody phytoplasma]